jgi:hypothetical protein
MPVWTLIVVLSLVSVSLFAEEPGDGCLKRVFMHYCLGGSISRQLERHPVDMQPVVNGERTGIIYNKGRERIYVMAYKDRIYKILQTYDSPNQVTLQRLQRSLRSKYGDPQDASLMPGYARSMAAQVGAVRRGEGEILYRWQPPGAGWRVELGWTRRLGISLAYLENALDRQQREAAESGL